MPVYEFRCPACQSRREILYRTVPDEVEVPHCESPDCGALMARTFSPFARHLTMKDKLVEAEARFGKEVDDVMGPESDFASHVDRYDSLSKGLPPPDVP
ncbi:MAG: hypothetical protein ACE5EF_10355 [Dehalococcoidia bacterium]